MEVLAVTILISLSLAGIFIVSFTLENRRRRKGSSSLEHASLLPFDDEFREKKKVRKPAETGNEEQS